MPDRIITFNDVSFTYPNCETAALRHINVSFKEGGFYLITGPSGSGKSTLLRLMKKSAAPYGLLNGEILIHGSRVSDMDLKAASTITGFVSQDPDASIVTNKVWHELAFGLENLGCDQELMERRIGEIVNFLGIMPWFYSDTDELSGGQKQILNLASVVVMEPEVLLLDEPTAQLDPLAASRFLECVRRVHDELGTTIIMTEHRLEEVFGMAEYVKRLQDGEIKYEGTPRQLLAHCRMDDPEYPSASRIAAGYNSVSGEKIIDDSSMPISVRDGRQMMAGIFSELGNGMTCRSCEPGNGMSCKSSEPGSSMSCKSSEPGSSRACKSSEPGSRTMDEKSEEKDQFLLRADGISFRYTRDGPLILNGLSLEIRSGEIFSIVGGNGSGKSTLLKLLSGALPFRHGKYISFGKRVKTVSDIKRGSGGLVLLPQDPKALFHGISAREEWQEMRKSPSDPDEEREENEIFSALAERLSLTGKGDLNPYDLSGGEQQRLALGKLLLTDPKLLLLDEPTKGLDPYSKESLADILMELKDRGKTVVLVTHDLEFAAMYSDRTAMMFDGRLGKGSDPKTFFSENRFYTTAAARISSGYLKDCVTVQQCVTALKEKYEYGRCGN